MTTLKNIYFEDQGSFELNPEIYNSCKHDIHILVNQPHGWRKDSKEYMYYGYCSKCNLCCEFHENPEDPRYNVLCWFGLDKIESIKQYW